MKTLCLSYRIFALTLALLMFVTSVGFSIDMHYCQGQLKSFCFFGKAESCHEMAETTPIKICPHHQKMMVQKEGCSIDKKDCCKNRTLHIQSDQDLQVQTSNLILDKQLQQFVIAYVMAFITDFDLKTGTPSFAHYKPPLIWRDIPVLNQTFLL